MLEEIAKHKAEADAELGRQCLGETWSQQGMRLLQLPGFGVIISMTVLSAIGEVGRFESANKLVGYSGLGAGVHDRANLAPHALALRAPSGRIIE